MPNKGPESNPVRSQAITGATLRRQLRWAPPLPPSLLVWGKGHLSHPPWGREARRLAAVSSHSEPAYSLVWRRGGAGSLCARLGNSHGARGSSSNLPALHYVQGCVEILPGRHHSFEIVPDPAGGPRLNSQHFATFSRMAVGKEQTGKLDMLVVHGAISTNGSWKPTQLPASRSAH